MIAQARRPCMVHNVDIPSQVTQWANFCTGQEIKIKHGEGTYETFMFDGLRLQAILLHDMWTEPLTYNRKDNTKSVATQKKVTHLTFKSLPIAWTVRGCINVTSSNIENGPKPTFEIKNTQFSKTANDKSAWNTDHAKKIMIETRIL